MCTLIMRKEAGLHHYLWPDCNVDQQQLAVVENQTRGQTEETDWNTNQRQTLAVFMLAPSCGGSDCSWGILGRCHVMHTKGSDGGATRIQGGWLEEGTCWLWTLAYIQGARKEGIQGSWNLCVSHSCSTLHLFYFIIILVSRSRSPRPSPAPPPSESRVRSLVPGLKRLKCQWMSKSKTSAFTWVLFSKTCHRNFRHYHCFVQPVIVLNSPEGGARSLPLCPLFILPHLPLVPLVLCAITSVFTASFFGSAASKNRFCIYFTETWLWCTLPPPLIFPFPFMVSFKII